MSHGPDHPQIEIFNKSKHGIAFRARQAEMNLGSESWVLGKDYSAAPTCSTCHMSATTTQPVTHDVGARISWTLRPVISKKLESWESRRARLQEVCGNCHSPDFVKAFYVQFDKTLLQATLRRIARGSSPSVLAQPGLCPPIAEAWCPATQGCTRGSGSAALTGLKRSEC